jgi:dihydropyrimidinase
VKLFTTYSETNRRTFDGYIYDLLLASKVKKSVILVHAENDDLIDKRKDILVVDHEKARPVISETTEVMNLALMAREAGGTLYLVHVSAGSSVKLLAENFKAELENHQIILESCPHYFLLNRDYLSREDGYKYTMTPPLRSEEERKLLQQQYQLITAIGTDHCPYDKEKKLHRYASEIPMGIGGLRYSFLNMYNEFGFSILEQFTSGPAKSYGIKNKGALLPGYDADIVIFDAEGQTSVTDEMSVYYGKTLKGKIESVYSRGQKVFEDKKVYEHCGRFLRRGDN